MIIHIWMHWFWITTASFKSFLFFTVQMISLSCISHVYIAEAGLLENDTIINKYFFKQNESSHIENNSNITSVTSVPIDIEKEKIPNHPPETTSHQPSTSTPFEEINTETLENESTSKSEDSFRVSQGSDDVVDTYGGAGGSLDVFQYPLKKFTKYSHIKYGKIKLKPKTSDESVAEEKKMESVKIFEEKVNANISIDGDDAGHVKPEIDKLNVTLVEGSSFEVSSNETVDLLTTTPIAENSTWTPSNATEIKNDTVPGKADFKDYNGREENETTLSSNFKATSVEISNVTEYQKQISKNATLVIENKVEENGIYTTAESFLLQNKVAAATSTKSETNQSSLNAGSITGITLGIVVIFSLFGAVSFILYRRRYLNKPQVLHDKCSNLDSSGYIDDTSLKENSEEMYSLDNDSFLNSLEAMTIQNYWTENVKHTKL